MRITEDDGEFPGGSPGDVKPTPYISVLPQSAVARGVVGRFVGHAGAFALHWGDGKADAAQGNRNYRHVYERPGAYAVVARENTTQKLLEQTIVIVRDGLAVQLVELSIAPDNPEIVRATFLEKPPVGIIPKVLIDWGDSAPEELWAIPGEHRDHGLPVGEHIVTVTDRQTGRSTDLSIEVIGEHYDPDFTVAEASGDPNRRTGRITITDVSTAKPIIINWGDLVEPEQEESNVTVGKTFDKAYSTDGDKFPEVRYKDGSGKPNDQGFVQIPFKD